MVKTVRYKIEKDYCDDFECEHESDYSNPDKEKVWCFIFEADCRGDAIALCEKHLAEALESLRAKRDD